MEANTKQLIPLENIQDVLDLDEELLEFKRARHFLSGVAAVPLPSGCYYDKMLKISRDDAPAVFAEIEAFVDHKISEIEKRIRDAGFEPTPFDPLQIEDDEDEEEDDPDEDGDEA